MATIQQIKDRLPNTQLWAVYNTYSDRRKKVWSGVAVRRCTLLILGCIFSNKDGQTLEGLTDYCKVREHDKYQSEIVIKAEFLFLDEASAQELASTLRKHLADWQAS